MSVPTPVTGLVTGLLTLALLTGCHHRSAPEVIALPVQPSVPLRDAFSLEVAERICNIDSLTRQYSAYRTEVRNLQSDEVSSFYAPETHGAHTEAEINEQVIRPSPGPQTAQVELVRTLELDVDASYRFATASCQAYAVCMYQHRYNEQACREGRREWNAAQARFDGLSARIASTRVELARTARPAYPIRPRPVPTAPACSDRMGGIFSTAGCRP